MWGTNKCGDFKNWSKQDWENTHKNSFGYRTKKLNKPQLPLSVF